MKKLIKLIEYKLNYNTIKDPENRVLCYVVCKDFNKGLFRSFKNVHNDILVKPNFCLEKYLIGKQCNLYDLRGPLFMYARHTDIEKNILCKYFL